MPHAAVGQQDPTMSILPDPPLDGVALFVHMATRAAGRCLTRPNATSLIGQDLRARNFSVADRRVVRALEEVTKPEVTAWLES